MSQKMCTLHVLPVLNNVTNLESNMVIKCQSKNQLTGSDYLFLNKTHMETSLKLNRRTAHFLLLSVAQKRRVLIKP